jgi:predicted metal-dependent peptidase
MIEIIYSISLLDAMKNQGIPSQAKYPTNTEFLKSKYKIDSLTFAQSSQYYASDYKKYKKMYEEVKKRLEEETQNLNGGKSVTPNSEEGIVK